MSRKPRVTACEFEALTFDTSRKLKMEGAFMSVRQHPQWWKVNIQCHTRVDGQELIDEVTLVTPRKFLMAELCAWIKQEIRALGYGAAYSIWVRAELLSPERARRAQQGIAQESVIYT